MEDLTNKTLIEIQAAMAAVEAERATVGLSDAEMNQLEQAAIRLRNMERKVVNELTTELVKSLKADAKALSKLVEEMDSTSARLKNLSLTIKKVANIVKGLIEIIALATKVGLL